MSLLKIYTDEHVLDIKYREISENIFATMYGNNIINIFEICYDEDIKYAKLILGTEHVHEMNLTQENTILR